MKTINIDSSLCQFVTRPAKKYIYNELENIPYALRNWLLHHHKNGRERKQSVLDTPVDMGRSSLGRHLLGYAAMLEIKWCLFHCDELFMCS